MNDVLIIAAAQEEYTASLRWYADRSRRAAEEFELEFSNTLESIASQPERFPRCDDRHRFALLRRFPFQVVFRETSENRWLVVAVAHTSRRQEYWSAR